METNHRDDSQEIPIAGDFVLTEFYCKQYEFTAVTDADISEHVLEKHTTWFNCGTCGFKTREKPEIESHLDQHNQDKYKCEECNVQLNNETID